MLVPHFRVVFLPFSLQNWCELMTLKTMLTVLGAAVAIAAVPMSIAQQAAGNFDHWSRPELEAVTAAPQNHKVLFENDSVRVLEVTIAPHTQEPLHVHRWPAVIYLDKSAHLIEHLQDGKVEDRGIVRTEHCAGSPSTRAIFSRTWILSHCTRFGWS